MLSNQEVLRQSQSAYRQWADIWMKHAKENAVTYQRDKNTIRELFRYGTGKTILCIGLAPSFEKSIETIKKYRDNVDIAIVDKALGPCIDHGIKPDFVFLSDAMVSYEEWCEPWIDKTDGIILVSNATANPKWSQNWKGKVYFTVNKDNIGTQDIYGPILGCDDQIPASSNVGNSVVVFATLFMRYDKYLLVGYDFVFGDDHSYYAFKESDKRYWMRHGVSVDSSGRLAYITQNLLFTCRWLGDYYKAELQPNGVDIVNCSGGTILDIPSGNLERQMNHAPHRQLTPEDRQVILREHAKVNRIPASPTAAQELQDVLSKTKYIGEITVKYYEPEVIEWLNQRSA